MPRPRVRIQTLMFAVGIAAILAWAFFAVDRLPRQDQFALLFGAYATVFGLLTIAYLSLAYQRRRERRPAVVKVKAPHD